MCILVLLNSASHKVHIPREEFSMTTSKRNAFTVLFFFFFVP